MSKILADPLLDEERFNFDGEPLAEEDIETEEGKSKGLTPDQKELRWNAFILKSDRQETMFKRVFDGVFEGQKRQVVQSLESTGKLPDSLDDTKTAQKFQPAIELVYHDSFEDSIPSKALKQLDEIARTWILQRSLTLAKLINVTTLDAIRSALAEGFSAGESIQQLTKRIEGYFADNAPMRAERVARTEVIAASNAGAVDRYEKEGIQQKEWFAALDERTRDTHAAANGQIVGIDEDFKVGDDSMSAPGQGSDPAENINCRCVVLPVV